MLKDDPKKDRTDINFNLRSFFQDNSLMKPASTPEEEVKRLKARETGFNMIEAARFKATDQMIQQMRAVFLYMSRLEQILLRWIAYHSLPVEEYAHEYPDASQDDELENLQKLTKNILDFDKEGWHLERRAFESLVRIVRNCIVNVQTPKGVQQRFDADEDRIKAMASLIDSLDTLRKKQEYNLPPGG